MDWEKTASNAKNLIAIIAREITSLENATSRASLIKKSKLQDSMKRANIRLCCIYAFCQLIVRINDTLSLGIDRYDPVYTFRRDFSPS